MQCIASSSKPRFQDHTIRGGGGMDTLHETIYTYMRKTDRLKFHWKHLRLKRNELTRPGVLVR